MADKNLGEVFLENVRLSFPDIFEPKKPKPDKDGNVGAPRYSASFLIKKSDKKNINKIQEAAAAVQQEKWGKNIPKLKPEKKCLRDGDQEAYDGYEGHLYLSASSSVKNKPVIIDRRRRPIEADNGLIYAGCYVNAIVRIWCQDNEHGKRINASLEAIQYYAPGEAFGRTRIDPATAFKAYDDDDDEDDDDDDRPAKKSRRGDFDDDDDGDSDSLI